METHSRQYETKITVLTSLHLNLVLISVEIVPCLLCAVAQGGTREET